MIQPEHSVRNLDRAADILISGLLAEPWGQVSASVYETGRLVALAPWLTGHTERIDYLLATQNGNGFWGTADPAYALVPTLSAVDALFTTLHNGSAARSGAAPRNGIEGAAQRGHRALAEWLNSDKAVRLEDLPDLPAIELTVPSLIERINGRADQPLSPPRGMTGAKLAAVRHMFGSGVKVPRKLHHALEVAGEAAVRTASVEPAAFGGIGASPAATAAWLGADEPPGPAEPSRRFLETAVARRSGPVPVGLPITVFERAWVISWLLRAGIRPDVPEALVKSISCLFGPEGTAAAPGLPADADTTAGALYALTLLGTSLAPDVLLAYETDTHFCTWRGEEGASITTNAHVLEAFGAYVVAHPDTRADHARAIAKVSAWLRETQRPDGSWLDRWHASPYYATACATIALHEYGDGECDGAVGRARRWLLDSQRPDGSWGIWGGTAEETAYALQTLLLTGGDVPHHAVRAGLGYLAGLTEADSAADAAGWAVDGPAMWHDKDLYRPTAIVAAAVLAALQLGQRLVSHSSHAFTHRSEGVANTA